MARKHIVKQGECISSIALEYGFVPNVIWSDPANADLKNRRESANVLFPGDVVVIPEKDTKSVSAETDMRHTFRRKGRLEHLCIRLLDEDDEPRRFVPYRIVVDGDIREGETDDNGILDEVIPPNARTGFLLVGDADDGEKYDLHIGHLDPITTVEGVQERLNNLGWECGPEDGILGPKTRGAIERFQEYFGLTVSGEADEPTRSKLVETHGS